MAAFQATSGLWGRTSSQAAGLGCRITALQAEIPKPRDRLVLSHESGIRTHPSNDIHTTYLIVTTP